MKNIFNDFRSRSFVMEPGPKESIHITLASVYMNSRDILGWINIIFDRKFHYPRHIHRCLQKLFAFVSYLRPCLWTTSAIRDNVKVPTDWNTYEFSSPFISGIEIGSRGVRCLEVHSSGSRIWSRGDPRLFFQDFADVARRSRASEVSYIILVGVQDLP